MSLSRTISYLISFCTIAYKLIIYFLLSVPLTIVNNLASYISNIENSTHILSLANWVAIIIGIIMLLNGSGHNIIKTNINHYTIWTGIIYIVSAIVCLGILGA